MEAVMNNYPVPAMPCPAAETQPMQETVKHKVRRHRILSHPVLGCVLLLLWGYFFYQIFGVTVAAVTRRPDLVSLFAALGGVLVLGIHQLHFRGEFKGCLSLNCLKDRSVLKVVGVFLAGDLALIGLSLFGSKLVAPSVASLLMALMAGVCEEIVFRVLPVSVMMRRYKDGGSILPAVILPALLFGLAHMVNLSEGQSLSATINQVVFAAGVGCFFTAVYLRTGSIVLPLVIHFAHDFICFMQPSEQLGITVGEAGMMEYVMTGVAVIFAIAMAVWMLKGRTEEIRETWRGVWKTREA